MKFNFRKIASVLASVVMIGSTLGIAAAANYPTPFVSNAGGDVAIVVGANAATSDYLASNDIGTNLQAELAKLTATTGSGSGATSSGGDSVNMASSSTRLYMNSAFNAAKTILTKDHLPTLLADGTATDNAGTEYKYTQTITPIGVLRKITFSKSGESIDPILLLDTGYSGTTSPFYNYTLTFTKALNVSDSSVIGTSTITMLGSQFTVGASSDYNTLYLYGAGESASVNEGESKEVTVAEVAHTVSVIGVTSATAATIEVDGIRKSVTKGSSYKFTGDFQVYIKDLTYLLKTGSVSSAELLLGAKTLHFEDNQAVRYGADDTTIQGTLGHVSGTANSGSVNSITIVQSAAEATGDYVGVGGTFTDRVLGGLQVEFTDVIPALDDTTRDKILIDTDNSIAVRAKFTSYLAGTAGEKTIAFARDRDLTANTALILQLATDANNTIYNIENATAKVGDWIIANDNDEGRIFQVMSIGAGTSTSDYANLKDVITNEEFKFTTGVINKTIAARTIGGAEYNLVASSDLTDSAKSTVSLTWGANSAPGTPGDAVTLYPRIKLKSGSWMSFLTQQNVTNSTTYSLPGLYTVSEYESGAKLGTALASNNVSWTVGSVNYTLGDVDNSADKTLKGLILGLQGSDCNFSAVAGPTVLIQESKTLADSNGKMICIPMTTIGTSPKMPAIGTPIFSDRNGTFASLQSNTYKSQAVDLYGTLVERDTSTGTNYAVTLSLPSEQMYADIFFKSTGATVIPGSAGSGSVMDIGSITVTDAAVSQVQAKSLIVVGGSCINAAAQKVLGVSGALCGAAFTASTGVAADQALIKVVKNPYLAADTTKIAMLVAGYEGADTQKAAKYLTTAKPSTAVGEVKLSTSGTVATVVVPTA